MLAVLGDERTAASSSADRIAPFRPARQCQQR
jgi:hypothetical protein